MSSLRIASVPARLGELRIGEDIDADCGSQEVV